MDPLCTCGHMKEQHGRSATGRCAGSPGTPCNCRDYGSWRQRSRLGRWLLPLIGEAVWKGAPKWEVPPDPFEDVPMRVRLPEPVVDPFGGRTANEIIAYSMHFVPLVYAELGDAAFSETEGLSPAGWARLRELMGEEGPTTR